jgi:hypothetical protein
MKTFLTTAVIVTALALPAFAEGDDPSTKAGEPQGGAVKATTDPRQDAGPGAMGQGPVRATTGAGSMTGAGSANTNKLTPSESEKSTSGADSGGSGGSGSGGSGSGGGSR